MGERHHHHLSRGLSCAFSTFQQHECKGLGFYKTASGQDKPWQRRAGDVLPHLGAGQAAGFGSHHTQPTFSMLWLQSTTAFLLTLVKRLFLSLLIKPTEGSGTSLSWTRTSTGMSLQLHPWFTISLSQPKTTLSPKGVVLPTPCPGHMLLLAPLCQHNSPCSYQQAGSVWWVIFQPD